MGVLLSVVLELRPALKGEADGHLDLEGRSPWLAPPMVLVVLSIQPDRAPL